MSHQATSVSASRKQSTKLKFDKELRIKCPSVAYIAFRKFAADYDTYGEAMYALMKEKGLIPEYKIY